MQYNLLYSAMNIGGRSFSAADFQNDEAVIAFCKIYPRHINKFSNAESLKLEILDCGVRSNVAETERVELDIIPTSGEVLPAGGDVFGGEANA